MASSLCFAAANLGSLRSALSRASAAGVMVAWVSIWSSQSLEECLAIFEQHAWCRYENHKTDEEFDGGVGLWLQWSGRRFSILLQEKSFILLRVLLLYRT